MKQNSQPAAFADELVSPEASAETVTSSATARGGPICNNGHPLTAGELRCAQCGARIKMQWAEKEGGPVLRPVDDSPATSAAEPDEATAPQPQHNGHGSCSPAPAGWYPAHDMVGTLRYWDGKDWTGQVAPMHPDQIAAKPGQASHPPSAVQVEDEGGTDGWKFVENVIAFLAAAGMIYLVFIQGASDGEAWVITITIGIMYLVAMFTFRLIKLTVTGSWR